MARPTKVAVVDEVREGLRSAGATILTEYRGLTVAQLSALRAELRKAGATYRVAKNTLVRIAAADAGLAIPDDALTGPTAVAFVDEDVASAARALRTFARTNPQLVIKGGVLEGQYLDAAAAAGLADLPSREELLAEIVGMFEMLLSSPLVLAEALLQEVAGLMDALAERKTAEA